MNPSKTKAWYRYRRILAVLLFLAVLFAVVHGTGLREQLSLDVLRQQLSYHQWSGLGIFVLLFVLGNLVQIPGWIFLAAAVLILGEVGGGVATYIAACTSCAVTFLIVRWVGGDAVRQLKAPLATRLLAQLHARPIRSMVLLRIALQTLPALNYALALSGVGFRPYMVATLLGLPLPIAVLCVFFDSLKRLFNID
ncbi:MAG: VTT domain-containing protein [Pseudomonadota bacterium]